MLIGGGEGSTFDPACVLRDSSGKQIQVARTGTTSGTFTGLSRYTQYQLVAYAGNSAGSVYSNSVTVWTLPEDPTITKPVVSNIGRLGVTITPGVVTDDGGKAITEIETYIKGGSYGNTLTSIGKGTSVKSITDLKPNTSYQVITRATNGLTEHYSDSTTFTTIGNPPVITDVYASNITTTSAIINYTATYDYNASFKNFVVKWRYPGSTTWTTLSTSNNKITNVSNLNTDTIEYMITITDNWNRSVTSPIVSYTMLEDLSSSVSDLKVISNSDDTYTVSATWNQKVYNKIINVNILCEEEGQQTYEKISTSESITASGITIKTKPYKNKRTFKNFILCLNYSCNPRTIYKYYIVDGIKYPEPINIINKNGNIVSKPIFAISKDINGLVLTKSLRKHDFVKLSKNMRYIQIDSKGSYDNSIYLTESNKTVTVNNIQLQFSIKITHISKNLYNVTITNAKIKTTDNSTIKIRNSNIKLTIGLKSRIVKKSDLSWYLSNLTINGSWQDLDVSSYEGYLETNDDYNTDITYYVQLEYNSYFYQKYYVGHSGLYNSPTTIIDAGNADVLNNHLCKIEVYDNNGNNVALNKSIKLLDGSNPIIYNGGNATDNSTVDNNKFIYSNNGLPLVLDLGKEYQISKIKIWRRNNLNSQYKYSRSYIHGRNKNNELCYIFFDSNRDLQYLESSSGKEFIVK